MRHLKVYLRLVLNFQKMKLALGMGMCDKNVCLDFTNRSNIVSFSQNER